MDASEERGRASAILLLVAVVAAAVAAVLVPSVLRWKALGEDIVVARARLSDASENQRGIDALVTSGSVWRDFIKSPSSGLVMGETADTVNDAARNRLVSVIEAHGGTISMSDVVSEEATGTLSTRIRSEATAVLDKAKLPSLLFTLESEPPYMVLDRITISETADDKVALRLSGVMFRFDPKVIEE